MIASIDPSSGDFDGGACYVSPDGQLALTISQDVDGESLLGFHGFDWSVQASSLSEAAACSVEQAIEQFVRNVVEDRSLIAVLWSGDVLVDVWITEDPEADKQFVKEGEVLTFRRWSGQSLDPPA